MAPFLFDRRGFLTYVGGAVLQAALIEYGYPRRASAQRLGGHPFTLGVASGDPWPDSVVLWTRLAPQPLDASGGMPSRPISVQWRVAADERMSRVVRRGSAMALPELAHSVHVEVGGLEPARGYFYQFTVDGEESPVGRTRTAPRRGSLDPVRFAFASCQHYENGFYHAHQHLANESVDFAVHLGDYIYEGAAGAPLSGRSHLPAHEAMSLADYRIRYAQYKSDPVLQAVHAAFPWIVTWDDHETRNDYGGLAIPNSPDTDDARAAFALRRAQAYQAYYEHMPLRAAQLPTGSALQLYRHISFGALMSMHVLDTRQYRSARPPANCDAAERRDGYCPGALDKTRSIQGAAQHTWLVNGLTQSQARWNLLANQVPFAPNDTNVDPLMRTLGGEKWDGYPLERQAILDVIAERRLVNTVVITGDVHQNIVRDVPPDHVRLDAAAVATEFIGTSITTGGDRQPNTVFGGNANNPHQQFLDNHHGYVRCIVTRDQWRTDYRIVPAVTTEALADISDVASFIVEKGRAGAVRA